MTSQDSVAFIGFGEAGLAIAETLAAQGKAGGMRAYDIKLDDAHDEPAMRARIEAAGLQACASVKDAVDGAAAGGIYIDVAVMAPITPRGHETPMLAATEDPDGVAARLQAAGLSPRFVGSEVGRASTIKMLRSVMVKGMEALTVECFRAAVRAGVADEVASSLDASESGLGWAAQTAYNMERMTAHGIRRAAEMREVAKTLRGFDVAPAMTTGTISWEEEMGNLDLTLEPGTALAEQMALIENALKAKS